MCKENINILIGNRVKRIRKQNGETQNDLAKAIHTEQSHISKIENGTKALTMYNLFAIAEHYKITVDYILTGVSDSVLLEKLKKYVSAGYNSYEDGELYTYSCPVLLMNTHFFEYLLQEAKIKKDKKLSDHIKEEIIDEKKRDFYSYIAREENENEFLEVVPAPIKAVLPDDSKKDWKQYDLIKYIESAYYE